MTQGKQQLNLNELHTLGTETIGTQTTDGWTKRRTNFGSMNPAIIVKQGEKCSFNTGKPVN